MDEIENENQQKMEEFMKSKNISRPHKIPVPTQYRQAAKILKQIVEDGKSFKELVYNNKHIVSEEETIQNPLLIAKIFRKLEVPSLFLTRFKPMNHSLTSYLAKLKSFRRSQMSFSQKFSLRNWCLVEDN